MKFLCPCGELIRDQTDEVPHKAWLIADEDWFSLHDVIDDLVAHAPAAEDEVLRRTGGFWSQLYQCPVCGRLFVWKRGLLWGFNPEDATVPRDLLRGDDRRDAESGHWVNLREPEAAGAADASERDEDA